MSDTMIVLPTPLECDEAQFQRTGASAYTWSCNEGAALWDALKSARAPAGLWERIQTFAAAVDRVSRSRPDLVRDLVILNDGCREELLLMPASLRSIYLSGASETGLRLVDNPRRGL